MGTSLFIIANKNGVACASDTDYSIHQLSKEEPVAIIVCKSSPLPWEDIIGSYRDKGEPEYHTDFSEYANDFAKFLATYHDNLPKMHIAGDDLRVIFLGYGTDDIYPSIYDTSVIVGEDGGISMQEGKLEKITHENNVVWKHIGDFDSLSVLFNGVTPQMRKQMKTAIGIKYKAFKDVTENSFKATENEKPAHDAFEKFDADKMADKACDKATSTFNKQAATGLETFSIEEMIYACESLVNANIRINHLKAGGKGLLGQTREIAIVVRTEGVTWIKHSLFAK